MLFDRSPADERRIRQTVAKLRHPVTRTPLGEDALSGVVLKPEVHGNAVTVILTLTLLPDEQAEMDAGVSAAVGKLRGVTQVRVGYTRQRAAEPEAPVVAARRAPPPPLELKHLGRIIAVASGKGGVGKSTVAAHLALALAAKGLRVGLMDADIYGPSVPKLFGLTQRPETVERKLVPLEKQGLKLMSMGLMVAEGAPIVWRGAMVQSAMRQLLQDVAWGELDSLVVDMPPGTGDAQLSLAQSAILAGAVIVSTPQDLALIDAHKAIGMFGKVGVKVLGVVENMSTFICPHCGKDSAIFGHGGARAEAAKEQVPFLGEIPLTMKLREACDAGALGQDVDLNATFRGIADQVWQALEGQA